MFRTSAPTFLPSVTPSLRPTTTLPSAVPSLTGWVATVSASTVVTTAIDSNEIENYAASVAEYYGVEESDVTVTTSYETTGTLTMIIPNDVSENELVDVITENIAESLGVHPQEISVVVDMETGEVSFTISSDDYIGANESQFELERDQDSIIAAIENAIPQITVEDLSISEDVDAIIEFTVDADEASNDLTQAAWRSEQLLSDFDVVVENNYVTKAPTLSPSNTLLPSFAPSITGRF